MSDTQDLATTITGSIQAAKSAAASPDTAQPEFFKTILRKHFEGIPENWRSRSKRYVLQEREPSLEELAAVINEDISEASAQVERHTIYQLLLRLAIVSYGIEGCLLRATSGLGGPLY
jgi:hypothetical protein